MKTYFSLAIMFFFLLLAQTSNAQTHEPRFPGCADIEDGDCADMKMMQFVFSNLKHPDGNPGGEATATFVVKASGEIANVKITHKLTEACDEELIRVVKLMPKWLPAEKDGKAVDMEWEVSAKFIAK